MRMRALAAAALALWAALPAPARAAGTHAAEFLRFPVGRPGSRSGAGAALDSGVSALYWNPAGLAAVKAPQVYAAHDSLPETMNYDFLGVAVPFGRGTLAYGLQALSQADLTRVDNTGRETGSFGAFDQAHTAAWGASTGPWRLGVGARFVRQVVEDEAGSAYAVDLGAQYDRGPWTFGAAMTNLGTTLQLANENAQLPLTYRLGAGWRLAQDRALLAAEVSRLDGEDAIVHLGATVKPIPAVSLSFGYGVRKRDADEPNGLAAGFGLDIGAFTADFTFTPFGAFGNALQVGAGYRFGGGARPEAAAKAPAPVQPTAVSSAAAAAPVLSTAATTALSTAAAAVEASSAPAVVLSSAPAPAAAEAVSASSSTAAAQEPPPAPPAEPAAPVQAPPADAPPSQPPAEPRPAPQAAPTEPSAPAASPTPPSQ